MLFFGVSCSPKCCFFVVLDFLKSWFVSFCCFLFSEMLFLDVSSSLKCCFLPFRVLRNIVLLILFDFLGMWKSNFPMLREHFSEFHAFCWIQQSRRESDTLRYPDARTPGEDIWVRSTMEGNVLHSRSAGKPVHVPIPSHRIVWAVKCRVPPVWTPILLVHWSALTDGQNTRESVKLLSYQHVGASMMSANVVLLSRQCNGRPP